MLRLHDLLEAYLRHLIKADEILAHNLLTLHNIHMLQTLMRELSGSDPERAFAECAAAFLATYRPVGQPEPLPLPAVFSASRERTSALKPRAPSA